MRIAVVHDYFTQMGGAEKVAGELMRLLPQASLASLVAIDRCLPDDLKGLKIQTSWMQKMPGIDRYYRLYFLLYPFAVGSLDLASYELVVSSSSGYAKGIRTASDAMHVCYCHTPMRWAWDLDKYSKREAMNAAVRAILPRLIAFLRQWDEVAARQPDHFIANSRTVAARIESIYNRYPEIIHPPIDINRFNISYEPGEHYLILSRLVSYKRLDLAIKACSNLNRKLLVIGDGPHAQPLKAEAGESVVFCGRLSDEEVNRQVANCRALIFPGEEDFGMAPLEVAAAGKPTIAYRAGGATETIIEGRTGIFFDDQEVDSVISSILEFERHSWSGAELRRHAEGFGTEIFQEKMRAFLSRVGIPRRELMTCSLGLTTTHRFPLATAAPGWS